jgi:hypothetical protein
LRNLKGVKRSLHQQTCAGIAKMKQRAKIWVIAGAECRSDLSTE